MLWFYSNRHMHSCVGLILFLLRSLRVLVYLFNTLQDIYLFILSNCVLGHTLKVTTTNVSIQSLLFGLNFCQGLLFLSKSNIQICLLCLVTFVVLIFCCIVFCQSAFLSLIWLNSLLLFYIPLYEYMAITPIPILKCFNGTRRYTT